jgi:hypothetical protein
MTYQFKLMNSQNTIHESLRDPTVDSKLKMPALIEGASVLGPA